MYLDIKGLSQSHQAGGPSDVSNELFKYDLGFRSTPLRSFRLIAFLFREEFYIRLFQLGISAGVSSENLIFPEIIKA